MALRRERVIKIGPHFICAMWDCVVGLTYLNVICVHYIFYFIRQNSYNYWSIHDVTILTTIVNESFDNSK
jgi:hypothetical protein